MKNRDFIATINFLSRLAPVNPLDPVDPATYILAGTMNLSKFSNKVTGLVTGVGFNFPIEFNLITSVGISQFTYAGDTWNFTTLGVHTVNSDFTQCDFILTGVVSHSGILYNASLGITGTYTETIDLPDETEATLFELTDSEYVDLTPVRVNQERNTFDNFAAILGLGRLSEESNRNLQLRILDSGVHLAGANYLGLINAINRDLGFISRHGVSFSFTIDYPYIEIDDAFFRLFDAESGTPSRLLMELKLRDYISINDLCTDINFPLLGVVATPDTEIEDWPTHTLIKQNNWPYVSEMINVASVSKLEHSNLIPQFFQISGALTEQVGSSAEVQKHNQYFIDYENGLLYCGNYGDTIKITYRYIDSVPKFIAREISVSDLNSRATRRILFNQELPDEYDESDYDQTWDSTPTVECLEIVKELLQAGRATWGV